MLLVLKKIRSSFFLVMLHSNCQFNLLTGGSHTLINNSYSRDTPFPRIILGADANVIFGPCLQPMDSVRLHFVLKVISFIHFELGRLEDGRALERYAINTLEGPLPFEPPSWRK
jgi:hypothetical protein